jgi:hypothetical protein
MVGPKAASIRANRVWAKMCPGCGIKKNGLRDGRAHRHGCPDADGPDYANCAPTQVPTPKEPPPEPAKQLCRHATEPEVTPGTEVAVHPGDPETAAMCFHDSTQAPDHQAEARNHALALGRTIIAARREWPTCSETALPLGIVAQEAPRGVMRAVLTCKHCKE